MNCLTTSDIYLRALLNRHSHYVNVLIIKYLKYWPTIAISRFRQTESVSAYRIRMETRVMQINRTPQFELETTDDGL